MYYGKIIEARSMHASFIVQDKLVCFGGLNEKGFIGHHIDVCEMDFSKCQNNILAMKSLGRAPSPI